MGRIQEARVLETAREMRERGDLVVPYMNGQPRLKKSPLAYWLAAVSFSAAGESVGVGRLYSALAASATALIVYFLGHMMGAARTGLWAALVLVSSRLFLRYGRLAETDMLLTVAVTAAFVAFMMALRPEDTGSGPSPRPASRVRLWMLGAWVAVAVAFLAKGPEGLLLPVVSIVAYLAMRRDWSGLKAVFHPSGLLLFVLLAAPWFVLILTRVDFAGSAFWSETKAIVLGISHGREFVYWVFYYLIRVWPDFAPWSLLLPLVVWAAFRSFSSVRLVRVGLIWTAAVLVQIELVGNRQVHYLLPALPPLALLTGWWIAEKGPTLVRRVAAVVVLLAMMASVLWFYAGERRFQPKNFARREFAGAATPIVRGREVVFCGTSDPVVSFYLGRTVAEISQEELEARKKRGDPLLIITQTDAAGGPFLGEDFGERLIETRINSRESLLLCRLK
jgi:4-amino-4-deoxy-L-arabinose transferase-like glycosyltransferase